MTTATRKTTPTRLSVRAPLVAAALGLLLLLPTGSAAAAYGDPICPPRDQLLASLFTQADERVVATGLSKNGYLVEILTNADGRSWTIIQTRADGTSCIWDFGEDLRSKPMRWERPS